MAQERRFASTIDLYVRYRPRYPRAFLDAVAGELGLDGHGRLLDLGCGPGFLAIGFRPHVAEAIGMDPEPLMLQAAEAEAAEAGVDITLVLGSSQTLGPEFGPLRAVTMGRSFHWMDRPRTLATLDTLVESDGAVVLFRSTNPDLPENAWRAMPREVGDRFMPDPDHPRERLGHMHDHEPALLASPFRALDRLTHRVARTVTIEDVIGHTLSKSSSSPGRLGDRRAAFEAELAATLRPFSRDGVLREVLDFDALVARRPTARASGSGVPHP